MCSVDRALIGVATGGISEIAKPALKGVGDMMAPKIPSMPELPNMNTTPPKAPPPPAATAGSQTSAPFSLSMRPRRSSQSLRTDRPLGSRGSGLNIPM
jgi:hypothetical protein